MIFRRQWFDCGYEVAVVRSNAGGRESKSGCVAAPYTYNLESV